LSEKNGSFFVWRHLSAKQKIPSPRPWRLRGENIILDKYDFSYIMLQKGKDFAGERKT